LQAGAAPTGDTAKLFVTWRTLALRAERAEAFLGAYEPVDLGPGICSYTRGEEVLVAVATRADLDVAVPDGWRDVLGLPGLALCVRA